MAFFLTRLAWAQAGLNTARVKHTCYLPVCGRIWKLWIPFWMFDGSNILYPEHIIHAAIVRPKLDAWFLLCQARSGAVMHQGIVEECLKLAESGPNRKSREVLRIPGKTMKHCVLHCSVARCPSRGVQAFACPGRDLEHGQKHQLNHPTRHSS